MNHVAVRSILEIDFDRVADAHTKERTGHFAVESPVAERGAFGETAFQLDADQIHPHRLRRSLADGRRKVGCFARDHRFDDGLRWRTRRHDELSLHAGKIMSRHAANVSEIPAFSARKASVVLAPRGDDARRLRVLGRKDDVVLGAFPIDQRDLNHLAFRRRQNRVDLAHRLLRRRR